MLHLVRIALTRPYTFVVLALLILIVGPLAARQLAQFGRVLRGTLSGLAPDLVAYRAAYEQAGHPGRGQVHLRIAVHVGETDAEAEAEAEPGFILARIDPALVADARARIPTLVHARSVPVKVVEAR